MAVDPLPHDAPEAPAAAPADRGEPLLLAGPWEAGSSPPDEMLMAALRADLYAMLTPLTARERRVLHLRLGLVDDRQCSLDEVARRLGLAREQVRQLERQALLKLRRSPDSPRPVSYLG